MGIKCSKCGSDNPDKQRFCGECGTQLLPVADGPDITATLETSIQELTTGSTFAGRYQIIEELGKGGMGGVYKVYDTEIKERVALKLLKPEIATDERTIERFRHEIKVARKIVHKNVGRMYDLGREEGNYYITMEYVPGQDLKGLIRQSKQLTVGTAISIAKQVCDGLAEAHRIGVIHRDLKPSNVMIDREGNAKIMDFGIAQSLESVGTADIGTIIGTPGYMSPEQVEGKEVDQQSDIYSLGVILYEMLTGRMPFEGDTLASISSKQKSDAPKHPSDLNPQITEDLNGLILLCLEQDTDRRYRSAEELLSDLTRIENGIPTTKKIQPKIELKAETISKIKWKNSIAVLPFTDLSPQRDQEYFCDGMTEDIITKLSKIGELKIISRTSAMRYKDTDKDIKQIGSELGVATIVEGSLRKEKDNIRVTAQLINVEDGFHLWADTYNRKLESVFEVQDEVSRVIAEALKVKLTPEKVNAIKTKQPIDIEAYEYFLKGMHINNSRYFISHREKDFKAAVDMFEKAVDVDPDYTSAYTGLAWAYQHHSLITGKKKDHVKVIEYNEKAYRLDPNNPDANAGKAWVYYLNADYKKAYQYHKRAFEINPNEGGINYVAGVFFHRIGLLHQAITLLSRAMTLDPFYVLAHSYCSRCFLYLREYEEAKKIIENALELEPDNFWSLVDKSLLLIMEEEYEEAEKLLTKLKKINPGYTRIKHYRAFILAASGERKKALALRKNAVIYSILGMKDEAIKYLSDQAEKDYEHYQYSYLFLAHSPFYDKLRDDSRFKEILDKQKQKYEERLAKFGDL